VTVATWPGKTRVTGLLGGRYGGLRRLNDTVVPQRAVYSHEGEGGEPNLKLFFEIRDGRPECTGVTLTAAKGGRGLRTVDLAALHLDDLAIAVFTSLASTYRTSPDEPDAMLLFPPADEAEAHRLERDIYEARKARRGAVTRIELEEVARVYREHVAASPTRAVRLLLGYESERTAARRVQQARAAGLLPKTSPGKRKA
jgi:hypothetical protein